MLATPVGAIPDVIIDRKTGFIMENTPGVHRGERDPGAELSGLEEIAEMESVCGGDFTFERVLTDGKKYLKRYELVAENIVAFYDLDKIFAIVGIILSFLMIVWVDLVVGRLYFCLLEF